MARRILVLLTGITLFSSSVFAESNITTKSSKAPAQPAAEAVPAPTAPEAQAAAVPAEAQGYKIGPDDILRITVLQPDKLDTELTVSPDGAITFPYIGNVDVKGLTLMEVQDKIQAGLSDYMKYPVLTVSLKESRSRIFFIYGEVNKPGSYPIVEGLTVVGAVSTAGGFTRIASMNNIKLLRRSKAGGTKTFTVDVAGVMNGKSSDDIKIEPGDMITVAQRFF